MSSMLADVMNRGTGTRARAEGFKLPAAGKTGTTDDYGDAWFVGYTPTLVAGVWFGHDEKKTIMNRGFAGTVAVPAWARFMKKATDGHATNGSTCRQTFSASPCAARAGCARHPACRIDLTRKTARRIPTTITS